MNGLDSLRIHLSWFFFVFLFVFFQLIALTAQQATAPGRKPPAYTTEMASINEELFYNIVNAFHLVPAPVEPVKLANGSLNICHYVSTPRDGMEKYDCEAGYFCPFSSKKLKCTGGFYCGPNTAQPNLCCEGYYCPSPDTILPCPQGYFCGWGSQSPISCSFLANCPVGTSSPKRVGVLFMALAVILIYYSAYLLNQSCRSVRKGHHFKRIMNVKAQRLSKYPRSLPRYTAHVSRSSFDIQFHDLGLVLKNGLCILKGVSGELKSGRVCAIMGPSGSGKSTFIHLLTGSLKRTSGSVYINRERCELSYYQKLIGFVPQDDIMIRELTVLDILMHSAKSRLPAHWSLEEKKKKVFETIDYLGLYHVISNVIGTEVKRGLSGGQRKRVNIGMELVAEPAVLFLDEPASGLDSSTSYEVYSLLQEITQEQKITVAAVIHSPSPDAFEIFDDLLLFAKGGRVVYFGERELALSYFKHLGYVPPKNKTPSDFLLDIVSDKADNPTHPELTVNELVKCWERFQQGFSADPFISLENSQSAAPSGIPSISPSKKTIGLTKYLKNKTNSMGEYVMDVSSELLQFIQHSVFQIKDPVRVTPNGWSVLFLCFTRACLQIYRQPMRYFIDQLLFLGCGLFISMASEKLDYIGVQPQIICDMTPAAMRPFCEAPIDLLRNVGMFVSLGVYFAGISVAVATFGDERVVYWRETKSGQPTLPYFFGKAIADVPRILCAALMFTLALIIFWPFRSSLGMIYLIIALLFYSAFGIGYFISTVIEKAQMQLVGTASALAWAICFSGVIPSLENVMKSGVYDGISWFWTISAPRYAIECLYLLEVQARPFVENQKDELLYTYNRKNFLPNLFILFGIGLSWNMVALISMKLVKRYKMK